MMGWVIGLLVVLVVIAAVGVAILYELLSGQRQLNVQLLRLRRDMAHGLGYEIFGPHQEVDGGFLAEFMDDHREQRRREKKRISDQEQDDEWHRITSSGRSS